MKLITIGCSFTEGQGLKNHINECYSHQLAQKLKLEYYKPLNRVTLTTFINSIYRNFSSNIGGFIIFLNSRYKSSQFNLESIIKSLKPSFVLIGVKLNNKIYSISQLKGMKNLSYKQNVFVFHRTLDKYLKTSYVLTNKKRVSK